ncbi:hypothetical protein Patl1_27079 [Pistacia atlantica]|uniref:Uncharacterized protein n=1 Tax=Pistacia atlantica TaxID=434234 RepID=A0ACC1B2M4_9ROSI|nr:hypothetical protein Patl1_27079 [Pistacia atlantica]
MPIGSVSFERKVLPLDHHPLFLSYPDAYTWRKSIVPLYPFEAYSLGLIVDHPTNALQVDFAKRYIGSGALHRGCVQLHEASSTGVETNGGISVNMMLRNSDQKTCQFLRHKAIMQWLAASQH